MSLALQTLALVVGTVLLARLAESLRLPSLLGMIAAGAVLATIPPGEGVDLADVASPCRLAVLAVVLLRAGLGLSIDDVRRSGRLAIKVGVIPLLLDAGVVALGGHLLLDLEPSSAVALGFLVAAISPAIVIPGLIDILGSLTGERRRGPAALLTAAPLDNVIAVVALGIAVDVAVQEQTSLTALLLGIPATLATGVGAGLATGVVLAAARRRAPAWADHPSATFVLWVAAGGLTVLGQLTGGSFVLAILACGAAVRQLAPDAAEHLAERLGKVWEVAQYALFGLIGFAVDLGPIAPLGAAAVGVLLLGQLGRAAGSWLSTADSGLGTRERLACILSFIPKATIQAAFAGLALDRGVAGGDIVLGVGVLAIVLTAPVGVIALNRGAARLFAAPEPADRALFPSWTVAVDSPTPWGARVHTPDLPPAGLGEPVR